MLGGGYGESSSSSRYGAGGGQGVCHIITSCNYSLLSNHTHTHTQPFYSSLDFVWDNPGKPVPEETFTHSHFSWSSVIPYLLHPSNTIHGILPVQFTCLTVFSTISLQVFFGLLLGLAPSTHAPYISSPSHCFLFAAHINTDY